MAGFRLTLKRLAREYGLPLSGLSYQRLVSRIVEDNVRRASEAAARVSGLRYRRALKPALDSGALSLPAYAVGIPTLRKAAESGRAISDTLRDSLTRSLRAAMEAHPDDPEAAIREMQSAVSSAMSPYASRAGDPTSPPAHVRTIAVTEVRSALDLARWEYARRFVQENPGASAVKVWRHNGHLVRDPRPHHRAADGQSVPLAEPFRLAAPEGALQAMHPHDPALPAREVVGCQCSYDVTVEASPGPAPVRKSLPTVTVENPAGSVRHGTGPDGKPWATRMSVPYGYIDGTRGADGEEVDCFVGPDLGAPEAYVFTIRREGSAEPDEDKVMLGFRSAVEAQRQLQAHYDFPFMHDFRAVPSTGLLEYLNGKVWKARAPAPKVGERVTRPDGTVWEKTGTFSYRKVSHT